MPRPNDPAHRQISHWRLCREVTMQRVLGHLNHLHRLKGSGPRRRGPCPIHAAPGDRNSSFSVDLERNLFICFSAQCRASGTCIDLWAAMHRLDRVDAARDLARTFGIE
jgi:DNA primase